MDNRNETTDHDKGVKVILNGTLTSLPRKISFEELTKRAFPDVLMNDMIEWDVDYAFAENGEPRELRPGEFLEVAREMTINVSYTDKS